MFQSQSVGNSSSSCSLAQSGNIFTTTFTCINPNTSWILDSGATDHMTGSSQLFSSYSPCAGNQKVKIAYGSFATVAGKGKIIISPLLTLKDVLHVPHLSYNLLSVSKLTRDHNCKINFWSSHCKFQDLTSGKTIGDARQDGGLYLFNNGSNFGRQDQQTCFNSISSNNEIMLWHFRLGHPSFQYLKQLLPKLFMNKNAFSFQCEVCELAKHHRAVFLPQPYQKSKPFTMIHSDVWGPSRVATFSGKRWFLTFIDDHTRVTWVFLLKDKSDAESVFKKFYTMVQTQFQTQIKIFRSDNGKEFFNHVLGNFFDEKGIIHQSSCSNTP